MGKRKFEARVIDPILSMITKNLDYLTQPENLPQLAKLGFMYNTLWYVGRHSYGYNGEAKISAQGQCKDNPKYKLEVCDKGTDEQYNLVYDAWGMHISEKAYTLKEFTDIIRHGRKLMDWELKMTQPNKTMQDWIEIKTDPLYRYKSQFPNKKQILNYLLCTIGTGYGYKDGYIIKEASGADQDQALYGDWENSTLDKRFTEKVNKILEDDEVEIALETLVKSKAEYKEKKLRKEATMFHRWEKIDGTNRSIEELMEAIEDGSFYEENKPSKGILTEEKYKSYYPICEYSIITMIDKDSHPSYIESAIEICQDIILHQKEELEQAHPNKNIDFAKEFMEKDFVKNLITIKNNARR